MSRWFSWVVFAVFFGLGAPVSAAERALPGLNVSALAATSERLYVAGFDDGLYAIERDGSARRAHDAATSPHINALAWSEAAQTLWLGTARGLVRCDMRQGQRCSRLGSTSAVHALLLRGDGSLVAGGDAGLSFVSDGAVRAFGKKQSAPFRSVWALAEAGGRLFVGSTNGLFWGEPSRFVPGAAVKLERAAIVLGNLPDDWVTALLPLSDELLVGTYNAGVVSFSLSGAAPALHGADRAPGYVNPAGLFALDEAHVAIASMDGLRRGALGDTHLTPTQARDVTALAPALGGGYWVGTRQGLERLPRLSP